MISFQLIDMVFFGLAYVMLVYLVMIMIKSPKRPRRNNGEGDGGVEDAKPPQIDLPPGVVWHSDHQPKKTKTPLKV
ncbi:hypothetical protein [Echinicola pacifica]|uniref:hypothetical protein n=1 Tax=Echinicola pacifica TaxID=346377 RepID=UPI00039A86E3|nr:hypothetical protein [Echinicola pacifica]